MTPGVRGTGVFRGFELGDVAAVDAAVAAAPGVDDHLAEHDMVVFVSWSCPYCQLAVQELGKAGVPFEPVDVDANGKLRRELYDKTGVTSVPSAWVKGTFIGGCNDGPEKWMGILPCLHSGRIEELLKGDRTM